MDSAFRRDRDTGEPADQALSDFPCTPTGVLALYVQDKVLHLKRKLMGIPIGAPAPAGEPQTADAHPLPNTPSTASLPPKKKGESVTYVSGTICHLCVGSLTFWRRVKTNYVLREINADFRYQAYS